MRRVSCLIDSTKTAASRTRASGRAASRTSSLAARYDASPIAARCRRKAARMRFSRLRAECTDSSRACGLSFAASLSNARTMLCSEANRFAIDIALLKHTPEGSACAARPREIAHSSAAEIRRIEIAGWLVHNLSMIRSISKILSPAIALCWLSSSVASTPTSTPRPIAELAPVATIKLGKTADWVAITADAVWVASTGPFAVNRIDPKTNARVASVELPGEACAGLAVGAGSLWVPLCTAKPSLARIDLKSNAVTSIYPLGPPAEEGGIAYGAGSIWLIVDKLGSLARISPDNGAVLDTFHAPAGSYNPAFQDGTVW